MDDNIRGFPGYHITKEGKLYRYGKLLKVYHHHRYLAIVNCKLPRLIGKNNPQHGLRGSKNPNAKLKPEDRVKIKELHVKGISAREIRNKYFPNVCEETIRRTINQCLI